MNGNGNLCRSLVRAGARLGTMNKQGISIFNAPVATKQLLFKLLGKGSCKVNKILFKLERGWNCKKKKVQCFVKKKTDS